MSMLSHIEHLQQQRDFLKKQINDAYIHHRSDMEIKALKKQKLRLKDEIATCKRKQAA